MRSQYYRIQIHDPKVATVCLHLAFHWPLGDSSNKLAVLGSVDLVKSLARSLLRCVRFKCNGVCGVFDVNVQAHSRAKAHHTGKFLLLLVIWTALGFE